MLTTKKLKEFARSRECILGVANIERFKDAPPMMSPISIFPEARSVIAIARRIPRGTLRGIEEGTYWPSYTYFGYHGLLNTWFRPKVAYEIACLIEDHGWEAALNYPGVPQRHPDARDHSVKPIRGQSNVQMQVRIAAQAAGIGEISWSKVFMTKEFGTRVRLETILTDAPLEPDPIMPSGTICDRCMACVKACPRVIIELRKKGPKGRRVFVSCINKDKGSVARKACKAACIGCGKCVEECPFDAIVLENNLAYIDFEKCRLCRKCVVVCPTHAIHEINFPPRKPIETKEASKSNNE